MKGDGDCFVVAASLVVFELAFGDDALVCHGTVTGQGPIEGIAHDHAWIELGTVVIDKSNGKNIVMPRSAYYAIGDARDVHRYTVEEARQQMNVTRHFGPWHKSS